MGQRCTLFALLLALGGCRGPASTATAPAAGASPEGARAVPTAAVTPPLTITPTPLGVLPAKLAGARGAPHVGAIEQVVLASDRPAAITQGSLGDIRLWTALDGTAEPVALPMQGARSLSLASHQQGWRIALVDTAGAAQLWHYQKSAGFAQLFAQSPHRGFRQVSVLPGGTHAIALHTDHSLSLLDDQGRELASLSARGFRPMSIRLTRDGHALIALSTRPSQSPLTEDLPSRRAAPIPGSHDVDIAAVSIATDKRPSLTLGRRTTVSIKDIVGAPQVAISADGQRAAFVQSMTANQPYVDMYAVELAVGKPLQIAHKLPTGRHTAFGFIDDRTLLVAGTPEGRGWQIDTVATMRALAGEARSGSTRQRHAHIRAVSIGASSHNGLLAHAWGQGLHLTGTARWLHIKPKSRDTGVYLGYRRFTPTSVAFSPSGRHLLWVAANDGVAYVEPLASPEQRVSTFSSANTSRLNRGVFIDDDHLALMDSNGRITLVEHRTSQIRATADAGGPMAQRISYDPASEFLRIERGNHDVWLYRVDVRADARAPFVGPYIIRTADTITSGFLRDSGAQVLWTLDKQLVYRTYTRDEIRSHLSYHDMLARGRRVLGHADGSGRAQSPNPPFAIDTRGRRYYANGIDLEVYPPPVQMGTRAHLKGFKVALKVAHISRLQPAPDGERFALVNQSNNVQVFAQGAHRPLWSYTVAENINDLSWSASGTMLALATASGGLILDATTGLPMHRACGPWFDVRTGPPSLQTNAVTASAVCGL